MSDHPESNQPESNYPESNYPESNYPESNYSNPDQDPEQSQQPDESIPDDDRPKMEPLTPEEKEAFLARARAEGRSLSSEEQYAIFGPAPEEPEPGPPPVEVEEMEPAHLDTQELDQLQQNFFPELDGELPELHLIQGVIFDFEGTLAQRTRPLEELMAEGAQAAEAFMRSKGMDDLPEEFWSNIVEARRFSEEKSDEENEEHIADDAMSFLLQFFGYPASKMDPDVLRQAVDIFYAPEMTSWQLRPQVHDVLQTLCAEGYQLGIVANYNCDRVFQRTIDYLGLRDFFDITLCSASVEYRKPDVKIFEIILERWDALSYEVVVVGDSLRHDIQGGLELGALAVQVDTAASSQIAFDNEQLAQEVYPDARLTDLSGLPDLVTQWAIA